MQKNRYKKLLYLLGLSSMLTLNGCSGNTVKEHSEKIETENDCLKNHLDENSLNIKTLSNDTQYVTDANVFYSLRERFLNNNQILNFDKIELKNNYFDTLLNNSNYLYLYDNTEIRNHMEYYMEGFNEEDILTLNRKNRFYIESNNYNDIDIDLNYQYADAKYQFFLASDLSDKEYIDIELARNSCDFTKYMYFHKSANSNYWVLEQYGLSSPEKNDYNKISIGIHADYDLNKDLIAEGNFVCEDYNADMTLNNGEDSLEFKLSEEQFNELATLLTVSAKEDKTVKEFLEENKELMTQQFGEEYTLFLEKTEAISYTLKK